MSTQASQSTRPAAIDEQPAPSASSSRHPVRLRRPTTTSTTTTRTAAAGSKQKEDLMLASRSSLRSDRIATERDPSVGLMCPGGPSTVAEEGVTRLAAAGVGSVADQRRAPSSSSSRATIATTAAAGSSHVVQLEKSDGRAVQEMDQRRRDTEMARQVEELRQIHRADKAKWTARIAALETQVVDAAAELRLEKQAARRAARDHEATQQKIDRLSGQIEGLGSQLETAEQATAKALAHASTLEALLVDAGALYGRLAETSIDRATYEVVRTRASELERDLTTAQARLLPLRISRQHQKDLAERVRALEGLLADSDARADELQQTLQSVIDDAPLARWTTAYPPLEAFLSAETTAGCHAAKAAIDATLHAHLVERTVFLERRGRDLAAAAFDDLLASSALAQEVSVAVGSLETAQAKLHQAQAAIDQHEVERSAAQAELAAIRSSEGDARSAHAALERQHAVSEAEHSKVERDLRAALRRAEEALATERDTVQRLASTLGQSKVAQEAMRSDLDKLQHALKDAHQFEAAYTSQLRENAVLAELTDLAEDEARMLAAQNAEILGQQNGDQRITYLGKIRSELLDYKQHSVTLGMDLQEAERENARLRDELASYRSVNIASKPATKLLRVSRQAPNATARLQPPAPAVMPLGPARSVAANGGGANRSSMLGRSSRAESSSSAKGRACPAKGGGGCRKKHAVTAAGSLLAPRAADAEHEDCWTARGALTLEDLMM